MDFLLWMMIFIMGWGLGYFINYLADVLPRDRRLTILKCKNCESQEALISFLLGRECSTCDQKKSIRFWVVQICSAFTLLILFIFPPARLGFFVSALLFVYYGVIAVIDIEHRLILHPTSLVGAIIMAPIGFVWNGWKSSLLGAVAGLGLMFALYGLGILFNRLVAKLRNQIIDEEALGFGDVILSGVIGLLLGWPKIAIGLFFAVMIAGLGSGVILFFKILTKKYQAFEPIPYAPFILISAIIMMYLYR